MNKKNIFNLVLAFVPLCVGFLSYLITKKEMLSYGDLIKPTISPPPSVFSIAWTILYLLMGVSIALLYKYAKDPVDKKISLIIFVIQLVINFGWSIIFFNYHNYSFAIIWLLLLISAVSAMQVYFFKTYKLAFILNIPYLLWLFFALYLNISIYMLN